MKEFKYTVNDKNGLHARPAGMLAGLLKGYDSHITVSAMGKEADGKRLLSLMSLGARYGTELIFTINGTDEEIVYEALKKHCEEKLNGE